MSKLRVLLEYTNKDKNVYFCESVVCVFLFHYRDSRVSTIYDL